jgi:hypothetical protein
MSYEILIDPTTAQIKHKNVLLFKRTTHEDTRLKEIQSEDDNMDDYHKEKEDMMIRKGQLQIDLLLIIELMLVNVSCLLLRIIHKSKSSYLPSGILGRPAINGAHRW